MGAGTQGARGARAASHTTDSPEFAPPPRRVARSAHRRLAGIDVPADDNGKMLLSVLGFGHSCLCAVRWVAGIWRCELLRTFAQSVYHTDSAGAFRDSPGYYFQEYSGVRELTPAKSHAQWRRSRARTRSARCLRRLPLAPGARRKTQSIRHFEARQRRNHSVPRCPGHEVPRGTFFACWEIVLQAGRTARVHQRMNPSAPSAALVVIHAQLGCARATGTCVVERWRQPRGACPPCRSTHPCLLFLTALAQARVNVLSRRLHS